MATASEGMDTVNDHEIKHWAAELHAIPDIVRYAVRIAGPSVEKVRWYLELFPASRIQERQPGL